MIKNMIKHKVCIIPRTAWGSNLRKYLTVTGWDKVRRKCYAENGYLCQICGGKGIRHPVECHEDWEFIGGKVVLKGLLCLCPSCHEFHHPGLAEINGNVERMLSKFMEVNSITRETALEYFNEEFRVWNERNKETWELDISYLGEYMGEDFNYKRPTQGD